MGNYRIDPKKQFSKLLARWTAWFWFAYMTWISIIMFLQPQAGLYCVYMGIIVTAVMALNVYSYTKNSIAEKLAFTLLDKTKIEIGLGTGKQSVSNSIDNDDPADEGEVIADEHGGEG